ncbi:MAG TPA: hypothetical protein VHW73_11800 [Rudaea sp.]|nr:hypothetical protein [Rudaea sp.]
MRAKHFPPLPGVTLSMRKASSYPADRSEAVLRILKGRTTVNEEAERMRVDEATVAKWITKTLVAFAGALADQADGLPYRLALPRTPTGGQQ